MKRTVRPLAIAIMSVAALALTAPAATAATKPTTTTAKHAKHKKHKKHAATTTTVAPVKGPVGPVSCEQGVDALAKAYNTDQSDDVVNTAANASLIDCGPQNGANGAPEWEAQATHDKIPLGNTPVTEVLAAFCGPQQASIYVCQNPVIVKTRKKIDSQNK